MAPNGDSVGICIAGDQFRDRLLSPQKESVDEIDDLEGGSDVLSLLRAGVEKIWNRVCLGFRHAWEFARSDPRKVIFSLKMGLALSLVSLLMFLRQPYAEISIHSVWAILTVVVVFEFTIGATLSKGFNRGLGTLSAGGLALVVAELSICTGKFEPVMIILSIFTAGSGATFAKLYPKMKPFEYGFRVFVLTFCFIMVSGYRTREFIHTAVTRFILIFIGAGICLGVNACVYPNWAGEDLHKLIVKNFRAVADSLEGCVEGYLTGVDLEKVSSKILTCQSADDPVCNGYRSAVISATQEETLEGFATWEPPHGRFRTLGYPWKQYVRVGGTLRHCAYMVMALHGCLLSEIQAPRGLRQVFSNELRRVSSAGAKVLRDIGDNIENMSKPKPGDMLLEAHDAAEELQMKIDARSYLLVRSESWVIGNRAEVSPNEIDDLMKEEERDQVGVLEKRSDTEQRFRYLSRSWDSRSSDIWTGALTAGDHPEARICQQQSWPLRQPVVDFDPTEADRQLQTFESASALSFVTFASLLMEFVARLDNLRNSFEELSAQARFEDPNTPPEEKGVFQRLLKFKFLKLRI